MLMDFVRKSREAYYKDYSTGFMRSGSTGKVFRLANKMMEKEFSPSSFFDRVLELGATDFNHLAFVRHGFLQYVVSDLDTTTLESLPPPAPEFQ